MVSSNVKISIIIPAYNCERTLTSAVNSALSQDYHNTEIIIITDTTSDDKTVEICDSIQKNNPSIRTIKTKHIGAGPARQTGLDNSNGELISFLDADDRYYDNSSLSSLLSAMNDNSDIVCGNYHREISDSNLIPAIRHDWNNYTPTSTERFRFEAFFSKGHLSYNWAKLYKKSFLEQHRISFSNLKYAEDKEFNFRCYLNGARYSFCNSDVYVYSQNPSSESYKYRPNFIKCWKALAKSCTNNFFNDASRSLAAYTMVFAVFFDGKQEYEYHHSFSKLHALIKKYRNDPYSAQLFDELSHGQYLKHLSSKLYRVGIHGFALCLKFQLYSLLSIGIMIVCILGADQKLSSTGQSHDKL